MFAYQALDARGKRQKGEIEADSERAARQRLKAKKLVIRQLHPIEDQKKRQFRSESSHLSATETVLFLQQLSTLTEAGMPLTEALAAIAEGMPGQSARHAVFTIRRKVTEGGSLADALREQQLDDVICNMIAAGEETGQLEAVSARLAELLEHRQELNQELMSATLYPAIIMGFGMLVMVFLMTVVVPKMVTVFERSGDELPLLTRIVIALSDFLRDYGGWLIIVLAAVILLYLLMIKRPAIREKRDRWLLNMPALNALLVRIETARFTRTLGMLLTGGVPALAAMHIANQSWTLIPLRKVGEQARDQLREGESLSQALRADGYIPHMAIQLLSVGEQSGRLDDMLLRVADHYEKEVSRALKRMLTIAEPMLVLIMALGVGALALAILLPIIRMNQLVAS